MVYGNYVDHWYHYNEDNQDVINVRRIGWRCVPYPSTACTEVDRNIPFTIDTMPVESDSTNYLEYEETAASQLIDPEYFIEYAYTEGYQIMIWPGQQHSSYSGPPDPYYTYNIDVTLLKKDNCAADFTYTVELCAEQGLPLIILTYTDTHIY